MDKQTGAALEHLNALGVQLSAGLDRQAAQLCALHVAVLALIATATDAFSDLRNKSRKDRSRSAALASHVRGVRPNVACGRDRSVNVFSPSMNCRTPTLLSSCASFNSSNCPMSRGPRFGGVVGGCGGFEEFVQGGLHAPGGQHFQDLLADGGGQGVAAGFPRVHGHRLHADLVCEIGHRDGSSGSEGA